MQVMQILKDKGSDVVTMAANALIADALRTLNERRIGAIVITGARDDIEGILSERDVVNGLADRGAGLLEARISDIMTRHVFTCTPETSIEELMRQMTRRRIRHLPVVRDDQLCGIVSIGDVVKHKISRLQFERDQLDSYVHQT
jgi:CBS domain-containing protein